MNPQTNLLQVLLLIFMIFRFFTRFPYSVLEDPFFLMVIHLKINFGQAPSSVSKIHFKVDDYKEE